MGTMRQNLFEDLLLSEDSPVMGHDTTNLMVGETRRMENLQKQFPKTAGLFLLEFDELTDDVFKRIRPANVIAPAMCENFDCFDLAAFLQTAAFTGAYRIMPSGLPRPEIVRCELRSQFPELDADILTPAPIEVTSGVH